MQVVQVNCERLVHACFTSPAKPGKSTYPRPFPLPPFSNLSAAASNDLDLIAITIRLPRGAVLFREDDPCPNVMILASGEAKFSCTSKEGKTHIQKIALAGAVLGLSAAISGKRHETTAELLQPSVIQTIHRDDLLSCLRRHGDATLAVARTFSEDYLNEAAGAADAFACG